MYINWFLVVILIWIILAALIKEYKVSSSTKIIIGPLILILKTSSFNNLIRKIAKKTKKLHNKMYLFGILVFYGLVIISLTGLITNLVITLVFTKNAGIGLVPVIPAITISLKGFSYFILPLSIAIVFHEVSHGIVAVNEKIPLKNTGVFFFIIFMGAFVELEQEKLEKASSTSRKKIYLAGITANILLASLFVALSGANNILINRAYEPGNGVLIVGVREHSIVDMAGIKEGTIILGVKIINNETYVPTPTVDKLVKTMNDLRGGEKIILVTNKGNYTLVTPFYTDYKKFPIEGGRFGLTLYQYYKPKYHFLSPWIPYLLNEEIFLTINFNLVLALFNSLPLIITDGDKILSETLKNKNKGEAILNSLRAVSIITFLFTLIIPFF